MKTTKTIKAGETRVLSKDRTDNPKLCAKKMSDGRMSLYLCYYLGYRKEVDPVTGKECIRALRRKKALNLYMFDNPRTPQQRRQNADAGEMARRIRFEKEQERRLMETGYRMPPREDTDFLQCFRDYIEEYTKKDGRVMRLAYTRFVDFLRETPRYRAFADGIRPAQMDGRMMAEFADYLLRRSRGGGANSIFGRFRKMVRSAVARGIFLRDPCEGVSVRKETALTKEILSPEEMRRLVATPYRNEEIRRAFLFCCLTGMRFCDVRDLTFGNVDFSNRLLSFTQKKTEGHSSHSRVTIPLNDDLLALIGEERGPQERVFSLLNYDSCRAALRIWTKRAGIEKHISWHCARHSFAVMALNNGAQFETVSKLLGHSSIAMTEKYMHVTDRNKRSVMENMPRLFQARFATPLHPANGVLTENQ